MGRAGRAVGNTAITLGITGALIALAVLFALAGQRFGQWVGYTLLGLFVSALAFTMYYLEDE